MNIVNGLNHGKSVQIYFYWLHERKKQVSQRKIWLFQTFHRFEKTIKKLLRQERLSIELNQVYFEKNWVFMENFDVFALYFINSLLVKKSGSDMQVVLRRIVRIIW